MPGAPTVGLVVAKRVYGFGVFPKISRGSPGSNFSWAWLALRVLPAFNPCFSDYYHPFLKLIPGYLATIISIAECHQVQSITAIVFVHKFPYGPAGRFVFFFSYVSRFCSLRVLSGFAASFRALVTMDDLPPRFPISSS
jgi:hypothetical protein